MSAVSEQAADHGQVLTRHDGVIHERQSGVSSLLPTPIYDLSVHHVDASIGLPREVFVVGDDHERCPALFV